MTITTYKICSDWEGSRLDRYIRQKIGYISQGVLETNLRNKRILLNNKKCKSSVRLSEGDILEITSQEDMFIQKPDKNISINNKILELIKKAQIHLDENIIAFNKPAGIAVQGGDKVINHMDKYMDYFKYEYQDKPRIIHRLDQDTTGVILFSRTKKSAQHMADQFKNGLIYKEYIAKVHGIVNKDKDQINSNLIEIERGGERIISITDQDDGKKAETLFEVISRCYKNKTTILKIILKTGRKHQIRVHLASINHPVCGDIKYGIHDNIKNLHLHSRIIKFTNIENNIKSIEADIPEYLKY